MNHNFLVAGYCCTWAIHLGYLTWIVIKWQRQKAKQ